MGKGCIFDEQLRSSSDNGSVIGLQIGKRRQVSKINSAKFYNRLEVEVVIEFTAPGCTTECDWEIIRPDRFDWYRTKSAIRLNPIDTLLGRLLKTKFYFFNAIMKTYSATPGGNNDR